MGPDNPNWWFSSRKPTKQEFKTLEAIHNNRKEWRHAYDLYKAVKDEMCKTTFFKHTANLVSNGYVDTQGQIVNGRYRRYFKLKKEKIANVNKRMQEFIFNNDFDDDSTYSKD